MNSYITIAYKKDGKAEILATPDVPYEKQRSLFKTLEGDYSDVEVWSRSMGKVRQRKVHPKAVKPKKAKTETQTEPETITEEK